MSRVLRSHWALGAVLTASVLIGMRLFAWPLGDAGRSTSTVTAVPKTGAFPALPTPSMTLSLSNVNADLEQLRGDCLTLPAGPGAIQCDDYIYRYSLLPVMRMGQAHQLGLVYNSALVHPKPVIGANITVTNPGEIHHMTAKLSVAGTVVDSVVVASSVFSAVNPIRVAFDFKQDTTTVILRYLVEAKMYDANGSQIGTTQSANGRYPLVDRRQDYGRGWGLSGYEQLFSETSSDTLMWVGDDGSTRTYAPIGGSSYYKWRSITRVRPDTIVSVPTDSTHYVDFNSSNYYATKSSPGYTDNQTAETWAFWIYPYSYSADSTRTIGGVVPATDGVSRVWWLETEGYGGTSRDLGVTIFNDSTALQAKRVTSGGRLTDDAWHLVIVEFNGNNSGENRLKLWIDGQQQTLSDPNSGRALPSHIGYVWASYSDLNWGKNGSLYLGGRLGEVGIYSSGFTAAERDAMYYHGIDFTDSDLLSGYKWDNNSTPVDVMNRNNLSNLSCASGGCPATLAYKSLEIANSNVLWRYLRDGSIARYNGVNGRLIETRDHLAGHRVYWSDTLAAGKWRVRRVEYSVFVPYTNYHTEEAYHLFYDTSARLDSIRVLGDSVSSMPESDPPTGKWLKYTINKDASGESGAYFRISSIKDPENDSVAFRYSSSGGAYTLDQIIGARSDTTSLTYSNNKVSEVRRELSPDDAVFTYQASTTIGSGTSGNAPTSADSVHARLDGPRLSAVGDTTTFWVEAWGAVKRVRDPYGAITTFVHGTGTYNLEALLTRAEVPQTGGGTPRKLGYAYGANGLLQSVTDSSIAGNPTTRYEWDTQWSKPTKIVSPENDTTTFVIDSHGLVKKQTLGTDTTKHTTRYTIDDQSDLPTLMQPPGYTGGSGESLTYDSLGNIRSRTTPGGSVFSSYKNYRGLDTLLVSPIGTGSDVIKTRIRRDKMGRDTLTIRGGGADTVWTHTTYNSYGDRLRVAIRATGMADSVYSAWTYDKLGRVLTETVAGEKDSLVYDLAGNVEQRVRATVGKTLTMEYDKLNRLTKRIVPAMSYSHEAGVVDSLPFYSSGITIDADTAALAYDSQTGMLTSANNRYAKISRTYTNDGLIETDTVKIKDYNGTGFSTHVNATRFSYDKNRRRTALVHPAWILGGTADSTRYKYQRNTQFVDTIVDPKHQKYSFHYDAYDRQDIEWFPGSGMDSLSFNTDGYVTHRNMNDSLYFDWDVARDKAGRLLNMTNSTTNHVAWDSLEYNGLGVVDDAYFKEWYGKQGGEDEKDGMGKTHVSYRDPLKDPIDGSNVYAFRKFNHTYDSVGAIMKSVEEWNQTAEWGAKPSGWYGDSISYSGGRRLTSSFSNEPLWNYSVPGGVLTSTLAASRRQEARYWYGADEKLMAFQINRDSTRVVGGVTQDSVKWNWGTYEEHWYDAFGRMVFKRVREDTAQANCKMAARCTSSMTRFGYDGDRMLYDIRRMDTITTQTLQGADTAVAIVYVYSGGAPLGIINNKAPQAIHYNDRGLAAFSTDSLGVQPTCARNPNPSCTAADVHWPAGNLGVDGQALPGDTANVGVRSPHQFDEPDYNGEQYTMPQDVEGASAGRSETQAAKAPRQMPGSQRLVSGDLSPVTDTDNILCLIFAEEPWLMRACMATVEHALEAGLQWVVLEIRKLVIAAGTAWAAECGKTAAQAYLGLDNDSLNPCAMFGVAMDQYSPASLTSDCPGAYVNPANGECWQGVTIPSGRAPSSDNSSYTHHPSTMGWTDPGFEARWSWGGGSGGMYHWCASAANVTVCGWKPQKH